MTIDTTTYKGVLFIYFWMTKKSIVKASPTKSVCMEKHSVYFFFANFFALSFIAPC